MEIMRRIEAAERTSSRRTSGVTALEGGSNRLLVQDFRRDVQTGAQGTQQN